MNELQPNNQDLSFLAIIFAVFLCALFGANAVAIKASLSGLGVFTTVGFRFTIASLAISLWAKITGQHFRIKKGQVLQLLIISTIFTVQLSLFYYALSKTNASRSTLLVNLQPFFVLFLAHYFIPGDRITKRKILGIIMGFTGIVFVFLEQENVTTDFQIGDLIVLLVSFIWSCSAVYTKRIIENFEPFHLALYPMVFGLPFFYIEAFLWDSTLIGDLNPRVIGALLYQGLVTASFGFVAWNSLLQRYSAVSLHSFIFIMPIAGVFLGGLLLEEPITYSIIIALLFIVAGILVIHLKQKRFVPIFPLGRNI